MVPERPAAPPPPQLCSIVNPTPTYSSAQEPPLSHCGEAVGLPRQKMSKGLW